MKKNKKYKVTLLSILSLGFFAISVGAATPRAITRSEVWFSNIPGGGSCKVALNSASADIKATNSLSASVKGWTTSSLGGNFTIINGNQDRRSSSANLDNVLHHPSTEAEVWSSYFPRVCTVGFEWGSATDAYAQWSTDYLELY